MLSEEETHRRRHEAAVKAAKTRKRRLAGRRAAETRRRRQLSRGASERVNKRINFMLEAKPLLLAWRGEAKDDSCVVCGEESSVTLQRHHVNPLDHGEGWVWICASCHNVFNKSLRLDELYLRRKPHH